MFWLKLKCLRVECLRKLGCVGLYVSDSTCLYAADVRLLEVSDMGVCPSARLGFVKKKSFMFLA